jgi:hypothetical protein
LTNAKRGILIGQPKPISDVLKRRDQPIDQQTIDAIKAIPDGHLQETTLTRTTAQTLLDRLVRLKLIRPRTYRVRSTVQGKVRRVFIAHERQSGLGIRAGPARPAASAKIPPPQEIAQFINEQQDRRHSVGTVIQRFLGREVNAHAENSLYHKFRSATLQAQALVVQEHGGKFVVEATGTTKVYRWTEK